MKFVNSNIIIYIFKSLCNYKPCGFAKETEWSSNNLETLQLLKGSKFYIDMLVKINPGTCC